MNTQSQLFEQTSHPEDVDEIYHIYNGPNISNVFFWNIIFDNLSKSKIFFDSIVECGVGRGRSLLTINHLLDIYLKTKILDLRSEKLKVYGLDSFEGFPKPTIFDTSFRNPKKGEWASSPSGKYKYNMSFIKKIFLNSSVTDEYLELIKGFFSESTKKLKSKNLKIGILHLDGDLYESIKDPLDNLSESVVKGGFIIFDDFLLQKDSDDAFPGARKAYEEFIEKNNEFYIIQPSIRGNVILKKIK